MKTKLLKIARKKYPVYYTKWLKEGYLFEGYYYWRQQEIYELILNRLRSEYPKLSKRNMEKNKKRYQRIF